MTIEDMVSLMSIKIGDTDHDICVIPLQIILLNRAQDFVVQKLERHLLGILGQCETEKALGASGEFDLTTLDETIFHYRKGLDGVRLTDGKFCNILSFQEYRHYVDIEKSFTADAPICYFRGDNVYVEERTVDVHIRRLRKALEKTQHQDMVQTVRGAGYRLSNK